MLLTRIARASRSIFAEELSKAVQGKKFCHWNAICRCGMEIKDVACTPEEFAKMLFNETGRHSCSNHIHILTIEESDREIGVFDGVTFKKFWR